MTRIIGDYYISKKLGRGSTGKAKKKKKKAQQSIHSLV
jgi:hypothetical protein